MVSLCIQQEIVTCRRQHTHHASLAALLEQRLGVFALQWQLQLLWHVGK